MHKAESYKIRHPKKLAFLAAYAATASVTRASEIAGIDRQTHYSWFDLDPKYAAAFEQAHRLACESMEAEAQRRGGAEGVLKPVYNAGKRVLDPVLNADGTIKREPLLHADGTVMLDAKGQPVFQEFWKPAFIREHSDTLLIFRMKGEMPEKYRDRSSIEHGGAITLTKRLIGVPLDEI